MSFQSAYALSLLEYHTDYSFELEKGESKIVKWGFISDRDSDVLVHVGEDLKCCIVLDSSYRSIPNALVRTDFEIIIPYNHTSSSISDLLCLAYPTSQNYIINIDLRLCSDVSVSIDQSVIVASINIISPNHSIKTDLDDFNSVNSNPTNLNPISNSGSSTGGGSGRINVDIGKISLSDDSMKIKLILLEAWLNESIGNKTYFVSSFGVTPEMPQFLKNVGFWVLDGSISYNEFANCFIFLNNLYYSESNISELNKLNGFK